jgi:hypothetical protein
MANSGTVVAFRSAGEIERMASTVRRHLGVPPDARISMQPILEHTLDLLFEDAHFEIEEDYKMAGAEARTSYYEPLITVAARTYRDLGRGEGRARMTIAHEIGHLMMHCLRPVAMNRSNFYDRHCDPEWQADVFAAALLMPKAAFRRCRTVGEAMKLFGVSRSAAITRAGWLHHQFEDQPKMKEKKKATPKRRRP